MRIRWRSAFLIHLADLVIYFAEYKSEAEWKDKSKSYLMYWPSVEKSHQDGIPILALDNRPFIADWLL